LSKTEVNIRFAMMYNFDFVHFENTVDTRDIRFDAKPESETILYMPIKKPRDEFTIWVGFVYNRS